MNANRFSKYAARTFNLELNFISFVSFTERVRFHNRFQSFCDLGKINWLLKSKIEFIISENNVEFKTYSQRKMLQIAFKNSYGFYLQS